MFITWFSSSSLINDFCKEELYFCFPCCFIFPSNLSGTVAFLEKQTYESMFVASILPDGQFQMHIKNQLSLFGTQLTFTCSKLRIKTPERRQWRRSGVFLVNFWAYLTPFSSVSIVDFEQINFSREVPNWI